jgi:hypothetical protein
MADDKEFTLAASLADFGYDAERTADAFYEQAPDLVEAMLHVAALQSARVLDHWSGPLFGFDAVIAGAQEIADEFDDRHLDAAYEGNVRRVQVLRHALRDAILVGLEISLLLRNGYPSGAVARWRTLHELEVVAETVRRGDEITAKRLVEHEVLRQRRFMVQTHISWKRHGAETLESAEIRAADEEARELTERYEPEFSGDYGWAHPLLLESDEKYRRRYEKGERRRGPNLADLRSFADLEVFGPDYAAASFATHGTTMLRHQFYPYLNDSVVEGPIYLGLDIPAIGACQALSRIADSLAEVYPPTPDQELVAGAEVLHLLARRTLTEFRSVGDELRAELNDDD